MPLSLSGTTGIVTGNIASNAVTTSLILNANVTPAKLAQPMTLGTVQNATGTSVDITGIPSWVKRVTLNLLGVSTNGTSTLRFRIGPVAGVETSGYLGSCLGFQLTGTFAILFTVGFDLNDSGTAAAIRHGSFIFSLADSATNTWTIQGTQGQSNVAAGSTIGGRKSLAGALSVLQITTVNGTDTFDAGSVNIMYEG